MSEAPPHPRDDVRGPGRARRRSARSSTPWRAAGCTTPGCWPGRRASARRPSPTAPRAGCWARGRRPSFGLLGAAPDDPVSRQIVGPLAPRPDGAGARRRGRQGAQGDPGRRGARAAGVLLQVARPAPPYRVAIIDAADDLNANAANAVLKTLEEPPERGVLLLISHAPGGLLPTIRSRCRRLAFAPPEPRAAAAWVAATAGRERRGGAPAAGHGARRAGPGLAAGGGRALWPSTTRRASCSTACRRSTTPRRWRWPTASAARRAPSASTCCSTGWPTGPRAWRRTGGARASGGRPTAWAEAWEPARRPAAARSRR